MTNGHTSASDNFAVKDYLLSLLQALDGVEQSLKYHPESDALYHSLQVFELALNNSDDKQLWLAALLHDVGKSVDSKRHAVIGADMVRGVVDERVCWLIEHHLDLLLNPAATRQRLQNTQQLADLTQLRNWDLGGRKTDAQVCSAKQALDKIFPNH